MASEGSSSANHQQVEEAPVDGPDYLTSLPPEMLDNIIARLPLDKSAGAGVLSRALRGRWESIANLDIWFSPGSSAAPDSQGQCGAPGAGFNEHVLARCAAPIRSFIARVPRCHFNRISRWLVPLAQKGVQVLILKFDHPGFNQSLPVVGSALFSCAALVHLDLSGYCLLLRPPWGFVGFAHLRILNLEHVVLRFHGAGAQLQLLIASAPHLTGLGLNQVVIGDGTGVETCAILSPNLRMLKLVMLFQNGVWLPEDLPFLEVAIIFLDGLYGTRDFLNTLRRISSIKMLFFYTNSYEIQENVLEGVLWTFQNLRVVQLTASFARFPSIMSIFSLLRLGPHIERLKIKVVRPDIIYGEIGNPDNDDAIDQDILDAVVYDDMFANLKHVSMDGPEYLPNDMWFMKFLLSKAWLLEHFYVAFNYGEETKSYLEACTELATCEKASTNIMLILGIRDKPVPSIWEARQYL